MLTRAETTKIETELKSSIETILHDYPQLDHLSLYNVLQAVSYQIVEGAEEKEQLKKINYIGGTLCQPHS